MERVNSWGREIKDKFSLSFKKDEEDIKLFLNEQPSPVEYLKVLVRKDMLLSKDVNNTDKNTHKETNTIDLSNEKKLEQSVEINDAAKKKILGVLGE